MLLFVRCADRPLCIPAYQSRHPSTQMTWRAGASCKNTQRRSLHTAFQSGGERREGAVTKRKYTVATNCITSRSFPVSEAMLRVAIAVPALVLFLFLKCRPASRASPKSVRYRMQFLRNGKRQGACAMRDRNIRTEPSSPSDRMRCIQCSARHSRRGAEEKVHMVRRCDVSAAPFAVPLAVPNRTNAVP